MFGFLTRTPIKTKPAFRRRTRLGVEMLERRDCPTAGIAPAITSFTVKAMPGHLVSLSGTVSDLKPASVVVHFSGEANAAVTCYPSGAGGSFYLVTPALGLGTISATATDADGLPSLVALGLVQVSNPIVTLAIAQQSGGQLAVTGHVIDLDAGGRTVTIGGVLNGTAVTDQDGNFAYVGTASQTGSVSASTSDDWGLISPPGDVTPPNLPPVITSLSYAQSGGVLTVNGTVWDEDLSSVAVSLSSNIEGVGGQSPSVSGDGSFSLIVSVSTHVTGSIGALATDCWGLTSDLVSVTVS